MEPLASKVTTSSGHTPTLMGLSGNGAGLTNSMPASGYEHGVTHVTSATHP